MRRLALAFALLLVGILPSWAQESDLEADLGMIGEAYARAYLQPLADVLGAGVNADLFHTAHVERFGINLYAGISTAGVPVPGGSRTFDLAYTDRVAIEGINLGPFSIDLRTPAQFGAQGAPTFFGDEAAPAVGYTARYDTSVSVIGLTLPVQGDTTGTEETIGGVFPYEFFPAPMLHLRVGSVLGTDLLVRWIPAAVVESAYSAFSEGGEDPEDAFGQANLIGFGVRHGLNTYLPLLPLDVAVQVLWQQADLDDAEGFNLLRLNTFAASIQASKQFRVLTVFGGLQTEDTRFRVRYDFDDGEVVVPIDFTLQGAVRNRAVLGVGLDLGPVHLHGSASLGEITSFATGLGISI